MSVELNFTTSWASRIFPFCSSSNLRPNVAISVCNWPLTVEWLKRDIVTFQPWQTKPNRKSQNENCKVLCKALQQTSTNLTYYLPFTIYLCLSISVEASSFLRLRLRLHSPYMYTCNIANNELTTDVNPLWSAPNHGKTVHYTNISSRSSSTPRAPNV